MTKVETCIPKGSPRILGIILLMGLILRLAIWLPHRQQSDLFGAYVPTANQIMEGEYRPGDNYEFKQFQFYRLGVSLPTAFTLRILGNSIPPLAFFPLLCSMLTLFLIFRIGLRFEERFPHAAALSCAFGAAYPILVTQAPLMAPDTIRTLFSTAAFLFFLRVCERGYDFKNLFLCGVAFGLSYLCQIAIFFMLPGLFLWLIWQREIGIRHLAILLGMILVGSLETLFFSLESGHFFLRLAALFDSLRDPLVSDYVEANFPGISRYIPGFFAIYLSPTSPYFILHGLAGWVSLIALGWALKRKDKLLSLFAFCWLSEIFIFNFSPSPSVEARYLLAGIPLLCLLSGAFLAQFTHRGKGAYILWGLLLISGISGSVLYRTAYLATNDANKSALALAEKYPFLRHESIGATYNLVNILEFNWEYEKKITSFGYRDAEGGQLPEYLVCLFNGYYDFADLPDRIKERPLTVVEKVRTGYPVLATSGFFPAPKIGFAAEVVVYRLGSGTGDGKK